MIDLYRLIRPSTLTGLYGLILLTGHTALGQGTARVDFELATEAGFPLGGERRWIEVLQRIPNVQLRVRSARGGERPSVKQTGRDTSPRFEVQGILTARNQLQVPGGTFSLEDRGRIEAWIQRLASEGAENLTAPRGPFGLTEDQLLAANEALQRPVPFSTDNMLAADFLRQMNSLIPLPIQPAPSARGRLTSSSVILDELQGLTAGTALAIAMRPHGIGVTIRRAAGITEVALIDPGETTELWPHGWPAERPPRETIPKMFSYLNVEITDTPLEEALQAIEDRVEVRMLYDHNALAKYGIEPTEARVKFNSGRTYYKRIVDNLLYQARLRAEIRIDESGHAFLWITSIRK